jgi:hypothetical protein
VFDIKCIAVAFFNENKWQFFFLRKFFSYTEGWRFHTGSDVKLVAPLLPFLFQTDPQNASFSHDSKIKRCMLSISTQGDQIGRIFVYIYGDCLLWIVFFEKFRISHTFWATFYHDKSYALCIFGEQWVGRRLGHFFHKLIWSPWIYPLNRVQVFLPHEKAAFESLLKSWGAVCCRVIPFGGIDATASEKKLAAVISRVEIGPWPTTEEIKAMDREIESR